jgi:hypothetical protein
MPSGSGKSCIYDLTRIRLRAGGTPHKRLFIFPSGDCGRIAKKIEHANIERPTSNIEWKR